MTYENLLLSEENQILLVIFNREKALNALNTRTMQELNHLFAEDLPKRTHLKGIVLTGAGERAFVAGADIKEFLELGGKGQNMAQYGQDTFFLIERFPKPVVAAVNGFALGGGCELAMACHLRVAGEKARFGQPEVNLGIIPGYGGTQRLTQLIGKSKALEFCMTADLDVKVTEFRERPLDAGPYRYVWIDALTQKVREGGRVVNVSAVVATAVSGEGRREIIGFDIVTTESTASWTAFLRGLVARGLTGVELVISDAHGGIKAAIGQVLTGAGWQRCRTHFMANLATRVTKAAWPMVAALVRSIFEQPDRDSTWDQLADVVEKLTAAGFADVAERVLDAADEILAFTGFPVQHWTKIRSNNPQERLNKEIRRRTNVVGIFPNRAAAIRLIGALLAEQTDEWTVGKRYMSAETLNKPRHQPEPVGEQPAKEIAPKAA